MHELNNTFPEFHQRFIARILDPSGKIELGPYAFFRDQWYIRLRENEGGVELHHLPDRACLWQVLHQLGSRQLHVGIREMDIAWVARGGSDPASWITNHGSRVSAIHIKDIAAAGECADEDGWADVGHGTLDWPTIMKLASKHTHAELFIAEHDNPSDHDRFAQRSIATMQSFT